MPPKGGRERADIASRIAHLAALRRRNGPAEISEFLTALRDGELPVAKTAAMGLIDRKAHLRPLTEMIHDADPAMRWRAAALTWFFMIKDFVPELIGPLRSDPDPMVRAECAWAMRSADADAAARALLSAVKDRNRTVAHYAAWTLRQLIKPRCPHLPSLRGARIPQLPLLPERPPRSAGRAPAIEDDDLAFRQFACSVKRPVYRAPLVRSAPVLDGRRDACYGSAATASLVHIDGYPETPTRRTDFRTLCTPDALHLHIRCQYRDKDELAARHAAYGSPVYADNSVEAFLEPSGRGRAPYFQICLNTRNARCDVLARSSLGHVWRPGEAGDAWRPGGIRSAVRIQKTCWNAELVIPFADLHLPAGRINKVWRMNVVRNAHLPGLLETTSWADMGDYDAHQPERFGWLWVDAGGVVNAPAEVFQSVPLPLSPALKGWTVLRGRFHARDGMVAPATPNGVLRWDRPIPFEEFEVAAEVQIRHQLRYLFAPDLRNSGLSFMAAYINLINEINVAASRRWEHWSPPYPGHLSIHKEVYPRLTHSRWYDMTVRVGKDRVQCLLDGAVHMELPNPRPGVRYFALGFVGGGCVRKLIFRPLPPR